MNSWDIYHGTTIKAKGTLVTSLPEPKADNDGYEWISGKSYLDVYLRVANINDESILHPALITQVASILQEFDLNTMNDDEFKEYVKKENFNLAMSMSFILPTKYVDSLIHQDNYIRAEYKAVIKELNKDYNDRDGIGTVILVDDIHTLNLVFTEKQLHKIKLCSIELYERIPIIFDKNKGYVTKHYGLNETFHIFRSGKKFSHSENDDEILNYIYSKCNKVCVSTTLE